MEKVLITFAVADYTGASRMGHEYIRSLRVAGFEVHAVLAPYPVEQKGLRDELEHEGVSIYERDWFSSALDFKAVNKLADLALAIGASVLISMNQADVKVAGPASRRAKIPYIAFAQNLRRFYGPKVLRFIKELGYGREVRSATRVISVSDAVGIEHQQRFGVLPECSVVVTNGVALARFVGFAEERARIRDGLGWADQEIVSLNVGRITEQKNQMGLVEAFASLLGTKERGTLKLVIVGEGGVDDDAYVNSVKSKVKELGIGEHVCFIGWRNDVPALLTAADVYAHPAKWEGWPLAPTEAMAAGCPVVMTDCSGQPYGLQHGRNCFCVPNHDSVAFSDAWKQLVLMPGHERRSIGRFGRDLVREHYDLESLKGRFVQVVKEVVA